MQRYKITIEYLGTGLSGWQRQQNGPSVQQAIEEAIFQLTQEKVTLAAAGRTDAGVHASGQVAHFDLETPREPYRMMHSINHFLKKYAIGIIDCVEVDDNFHARFSAIARHYVYRIINRPGKLVLKKGQAWLIREKLDVLAMQEGAVYLIGTHDFSSFRGKYCQARSPIKTLSVIDITQNEDEISFYISAPSFLHHMVRNIVGSLVMVGLNKWMPIDIKIALDAKQRESGGMKAPSEGLCLTKVDYPK